MRAALFLSTVLTLVAAPGLAAASSVHLDAAGAELRIEHSCANTVTVAPDGQAGHVTAEATGDHDGETAQLSMSTRGNAAWLGVRNDQCWSPSLLGSWRRTLAITVHVAPGTAITVEDAGGGDYDIGDVGGPLRIAVSGGVDIKATRVTRLNLDVSGGGDIAIGHVSGPLKADISGGADIDLGEVTSPTATIGMSGGGTVKIAGGKIGNAEFELSGGGDVHVGAAIDTGRASVNGGGSIALAKVNGAFEKEVNGGGDVTIGGE